MRAVPAYWKHVVTVLGGALGAQALPLLAAPLITRLCSPADIGAFSVWLGIVSIVAIAATLRLEAALILLIIGGGFAAAAWSLMALG
jgi:O-antigen/teichoic acid export membrane protein